MVSIALESITPEMAENWLANNTNNRNLRDSAVILYARDMTAGNWLLTGETIKFASDGTLLDGQHRLQAIIKAGIPIQMFVARGVESEAQKVMDTNIRRSTGDMLKLAGYSNHMNLAAAARLAMTYETNVPTPKRKTDAMPSHLETADFVEDNKDLVDANNQAIKYRNTIDISSSVLAVAWWEFFRLDPEMCRNFFDAIANNTTNGVGDPRNTLIQRMISARRNSETIPQNALLSMVFRAWNAWVKGDEIFRMQVSNSKDGGLVPIPTPVKPS